MRKNDMNIAIGVAGLAAAILMFSPKKDAADSGYGGAFPIPAVQGAGEPETVSVISSIQEIFSGVAQGSLYQVRETPFGIWKKEAYLPEYTSQSGSVYSSYSADEAASLVSGLGLTPADPSRGAYDVLPAGFSSSTKKEAAVASSTPSTGAYYSSSAERGQARGGWGV